MLREINLGGDTLRQTNITAINAELAAMGQNSISDFDHEAIRLPNGDTAVIALTSEVINVNGTPTTYNGNMVIVLNQNFQVSWAWNAFNWLSTSRLPTNGEGPSDWLHANSIGYSPSDGNLIVSLRAQDWVIKLDYANGTGDGHVVWTLGQGGNFTLTAPPGVQSPWFSHQHDVTYINPTTILVFDDGNTRRLTNPNADSRGQEYVLNEQTMTATLVVNADLGGYSFALGSAQMLPNGNLAFTSGTLGTPPNYIGQTIEVLPDGTQTFVQQMPGLEYRSYIMSSLYGTSANLPAPGPPYPTTVNLSSAFNRTGLVADGTTFSGGGLDGVGNAFSADALGTSLSAGGTTFNIGPAGSNDVVSAAGQTIALPAGNDSTLQLLATAVNGAQPNQSFTVTYTDGTTQTFTQSISDWTSPQGSPGALKALTTAYRDTAGGTVQIQQVNLYDLTSTLNPNKTVLSLILPNDANVELLAATLTPAVSTQVSLSSAFNRTGIVADGTAFTGGGLDGYGSALSANLLGTSLSAGGVTFNLGPAGANNVISAAGQTIALPRATTLAETCSPPASTAPSPTSPSPSPTPTARPRRSPVDQRLGRRRRVSRRVDGRDNRISRPSGGTKQAGAFRVYVYTFALNPNKQVSSLTLPNDANVELLAATLIPGITRKSTSPPSSTGRGSWPTERRSPEAWTATALPSRPTLLGTSSAAGWRHLQPRPRRHR